MLPRLLVMRLKRLRLPMMLQPLQVSSREYNNERNRRPKSVCNPRPIGSC